MKIIVDRNNLVENPTQFLRRAGYGFIEDRRRGTESFARRVGREHYPRFHIYIKEAGNKIIFDMHLDQKRASYAGAHAHNAEYGGVVVEEEIERLKKSLGTQNIKHIGHKVKHGTQNNTIKNIPSAEDKIGNRNVLDDEDISDKLVKKKRWFWKIFKF